MKEGVRTWLEGEVWVEGERGGHTGVVRIGQSGGTRALGGERPMGTATYGGKGFKGKDKGKGQEVNAGRQLRTAIHTGIMPTPTLHREDVNVL